MIRFRITLTAFLVLVVNSCDYSKTAEGGQQPVFQVRISGGVLDVRSAPESMEMTTGRKYRCQFAIENQDKTPYTLSLAVTGPVRIIIPQPKILAEPNAEKTIPFLLQTLRPYDGEFQVVVNLGQKKFVMPVRFTATMNKEGVAFGVLEHFEREGPIADNSGQKSQPKGQELPPKGQGLPPKGQGLPPKTQGLPPKTQGLPPKTQGLPPKTQGLPPKTQGLPPKTQGLPPKTQGLPPKGQDLPLKETSTSGALPPKGQPASKSTQQSEGKPAKDLSGLVEPPTPDCAVRIKSAMRIMQDLGCQVYRQDIGWKIVEQSRGEFKWGRHDWVIEALRSTDGGGCRLIGLIGDTPPLWLPTDFPQTQTGLEAYEQYIEAVVSRYADQTDYWEIWNEPLVFWLRHPHHKPEKGQKPQAELSQQQTDELAASYSDMILTVVRAASRIIRQLDPDATILSPGFADPDHFPSPSLNAFAQTVRVNLLAGGLADHVDCFCIHSYPVGYNNPAPSLRDNKKAWQDFDQAADFTELIRLLDQYKAKLPLYCTEFGGFKLSPSASVQEETAAAMALLRNGCILAHQGFRGLIATELYDYDKKALTYLVRSNDKHRTRGYLAYQKLIAALAGAEASVIPQIPQATVLGCDYSGLVVKAFRRGDEDILCMWNNNAAQQTIGFRLRGQPQQNKIDFWEHTKFSATGEFLTEATRGDEIAAKGEIEISIAPLDFHIVSCVAENPGFDWLDAVTVR